MLRNPSSLLLFRYKYSSAVGGVARVGGRDIAARPKLANRLPAFRHSGLITHWLQTLISIFPFFVSFLSILKPYLICLLVGTSTHIFGFFIFLP